MGNTKQKDENDKFYTKDDVVALCLSHLKSLLNIYEYFIVEPSAGAGAFYNKLDTKDKVAYDLLPEGEGIIKQDFLQLDNIGGVCNGKPLMFVGNPPFGLRNSLSKGFIAKSISLGAKVIAFILPKVYYKETLQQVFPNNWGLFVCEDLPANSFSLHDSDYHVPCCFMVWCEDSVISSGLTDLRENKKPMLSNTDFTFCTKQEADYFIFGAAPHKAIKPDEVGKNNRGYYIRFKSGVDNSAVVDIIRKMKWKELGNSSVSGGVSWLTKKEINNWYVKEIENAKQQCLT